MNHRVVGEALDAIPIDDGAVDASGLYQGDLGGDDGGVGRIVRPEQGSVVGSQYSLFGVEFPHGPMPAPVAANGFAFEPWHHVDQDERAFGHRGGAGANKPPGGDCYQDAAKTHGGSTPMSVAAFNLQADGLVVFKWVGMERFKLTASTVRKNRRMMDFALFLQIVALI